MVVLLMGFGPYGLIYKSVLVVTILAILISLKIFWALWDIYDVVCL
jgi:hypothetical protein